MTSIESADRFVAIAITERSCMIFKNGIGSEDLPIYVRAPIELDHRHVRTGQDDHGHDTTHRYPEYLEAIIDEIKGFSAILVIGHGHGKSSKAEEFLAFLSKKHPDIGKKVIEILHLNLPAMTEGEIKRDARQWFEKNYRKLATWHDRTPAKWFKS
jgi:hypothetical protein